MYVFVLRAISNARNKSDVSNMKKLMGFLGAAYSGKLETHQRWVHGYGVELTNALKEILWQAKPPSVFCVFWVNSQQDRDAIAPELDDISAAYGYGPYVCLRVRNWGVERWADEINQKFSIKTSMESGEPSLFVCPHENVTSYAPPAERKYNEAQSEVVEQIKATDPSFTVPWPAWNIWARSHFVHELNTNNFEKTLRRHHGSFVSVLKEECQELVDANQDNLIEVKNYFRFGGELRQRGGRLVWQPRLPD